MHLTPMTRYYIRRLVQDQAVALGLLTEPLSGSDSQNSAFLDQAMDLENLSVTKIAELDLLVRLHQSFSRLGLGHRAQVQHLESKLFGLLGLVYRSERYHAPTPPDLTALAEEYNQARVTLSQTLHYLNQISQVSRKYLGDLITRNYWQLTRPHSSWFVDYELTDRAEIVYRGSDDSLLTDEQLAQLQGWLDQFISQCQRVLPRFTQMLTKANIAPETAGLNIAVKPVR